MDFPTPLCSSCSTITLGSLLEAIPIPRRPRGGGSGIPNFFDYTIPKPLSLGLEQRQTCSLCKLIVAKEASANALSSTAKSRPLLMSASVPPTIHGHRNSYVKDVGYIFNQFGQPQPQWHGFMDGQKRANKIEPITEVEGSVERTIEYLTLSPWQVHVAADPKTPAAKFITRQRLSEEGSQASYDVLKSLLTECNDTHVNCKLGVNGKPLSDIPELPKRVIDVGHDDQTPHLVLSKGQKGRYSTLSHCWGNQRWVATTHESLPQMLDGFLLEDIPQTYADAIIVCRKLGIQYLWIDSFCILQNDRDDWLAESEKMGDIYEKAYCNIAATGAVDGLSGIFNNRQREPTFVRVGDPKTGEHFYFTDQPDSDFETQVRHRRLNTRGWVLQERILSRRTIHFASDMWYWECGEHVLSEDGWQHDTERAESRVTPSLRASLEDTTMAIGKVFTTNTVNVEAGHQGVPTPYTEVLWAQILRAYSRCDLTFWSDKLPALQGLANRFASLTKTNYHSGHWLRVGDPLPLSLMWYALKDGGLEFAADNTTPSWSCLKANGPIGFHDCRGATPTTMIHEISNDLLSLTLRGRLREAKLAMPNGENPGANPTYFSMNFTNKTAYGTFSNTLGPARFDDGHNVPKDFALLLVYEKLPYNNRSTNSQKDQLALVLQHIGDGIGEGVKKYKKIGVANVNNHNFFHGVPLTKIIMV